MFCRCLKLNLLYHDDADADEFGASCLQRCAGAVAGADEADLIKLRLKEIRVREKREVEMRDCQ